MCLRCQYYTFKKKKKKKSSTTKTTHTHLPIDFEGIQLARIFPILVYPQLVSWQEAGVWQGRVRVSPQRSGALPARGSGS